MTKIFYINLFLLMFNIQLKSQISFNSINYNNEEKLNQYKLISNKIKNNLIKNYHKPNNYKSNYIEIVFEPLKTNIITNIALIDFYRFKTLPVYKNLDEYTSFIKNYDKFYFINGFLYDSINTNTISEVYYTLYPVSASPNLLILNNLFLDNSPIAKIIILPALMAMSKFKEMYRDKNELTFIKPITHSFCLKANGISNAESKVDSIFFIDSVYESENIGILNVFKTRHTIIDYNDTFQCLNSWRSVKGLYKYHILYNKKDWAIVKYIQECTFLNNDGKTYRQIVEFNYKKLNNFYYPHKFRAILARFDIDNCINCGLSKNEVYTFVVHTNELNTLNTSEFQFEIDGKKSYDEFCPKVDKVNKEIKDKITNELNAMLKDYSFYSKN